MHVEFRSYATIRDAIGEKSVRREFPPGTTVEEALHELAADHDELEFLLFQRDGEIRPHVNVLIDEENSHNPDGQATELTDGVTVSLAPGVSGGTEGWA
jgi:molybdopterin synthase sulfur carrier subunit